MGLAFANGFGKSGTWCPTIVVFPLEQSAVMVGCFYLAFLKVFLSNLKATSGMIRLT